MTLLTPLNLNSAADLLTRKDDLVRAISDIAQNLGLTVTYPFEMMQQARSAGIRNVDFLEMLVELEAIKYTLCARRLREEIGD